MEECGPLGGPRLHLDSASSGPGRNVRERAERNHQSSNRRAVKPVGQSWADHCEGELGGDVPIGHRQGATEVTNLCMRVQSHTRLYPSTGTDLVSCRPFLIQVEANEPDAVYTLVQKERYPKFPFQIKDNGEILLTEQLDREEHAMVRLPTHTHTPLPSHAASPVSIVGLFLNLRRLCFSTSWW